MGIILAPIIFYVVGFIAAFIIFTLIEKRANDPEEYGVVLFMSIIWPIVVVFTPIVFGFYLLGKKYNQFVGRRP
ncbi:hypothetical protein [Xenorhabdus eapokensis]|uniref:Uncharacterized protein n=1 Tax=Xenorhabdus eapokensis TaxID=1873482 RepID=A0A1Q5TDY3_9GAMM|nr:hypothetical protein [Xenorhabdus eapokensis]OKO98423.1 hypothetical protein Xedl_03847 [Xenorhabdus eapokensis]